jgi:hypothetical protein
MPDCDVQTRVLLSSLQRHQSTLKDITVLNNWHRTQPFLSSEPAFSSLHSFTSLRQLTLDDHVLLGGESWDSIDLAEMLPPCLKTLFIRNTMAKFEDLGQILRACSRSQDLRLDHLDISFEFYRDYPGLTEVDM